MLVVSRHAHTPGTHPPCMPCGRPWSLDMAQRMAHQKICIDGMTGAKGPQPTLRKRLQPHGLAAHPALPGGLLSPFTQSLW